MNSIPKLGNTLDCCSLTLLQYSILPQSLLVYSYWDYTSYRVEKSSNAIGRFKILLFA